MVARRRRPPDDRRRRAGQHPRRGPRPDHRRPAGARGRQARGRAARRDLQGHDATGSRSTRPARQLPLPGRRGRRDERERGRVRDRPATLALASAARPARHAAAGRRAGLHGRSRRHGHLDRGRCHAQRPRPEREQPRAPGQREPHPPPGAAGEGHGRLRSDRRREQSDPAAELDAPVGNAPVTIGLKQSVAANDALRTGTYAKTLVFTLSTTAP